MDGHPRVGNVVSLPRPSHTHATCPWCQVRFPSIVDLLDHVDTRHLPARRAA
jgi:hypothetical protein